METTHFYRHAASQPPLSTQQGCNPWQADCKKSSASLPSRLLSFCYLCPLSIITSVQLWASLPFSLPFRVPYSTSHCISSTFLSRCVQTHSCHLESLLRIFPLCFILVHSRASQFSCILLIKMKQSIFFPSITSNPLSNSIIIATLASALQSRWREGQVAKIKGIVC